MRSLESPREQLRSQFQDNSRLRTAGAAALGSADPVERAAPVDPERVGFYEAKFRVGRFFATKILSQTAALALAVRAGARPVTDFDAAAF